MVMLFCGSSLDLDHEEDFSLMEVIADYLYRTNPKFEDIKRNLEG